MEKFKHEKLYRIIQTISIIGMFVSAALAIAMIFYTQLYSPGLLATVLSILVVSVSCTTILPWIKQYSKGEYKILCYVMFAITIASCVLWIIDVIVGVTMVSTETSSLAQLRFLKVSLIITFQFVVASTIASFYIKYRKTMVAFQVITYISNLYIDFYGSYALACVRITNDGLKFVGNANFVTNKLAIMFAVIALSFVVISSVVIRSMDKRKQKDALAPMFGSQENQPKVAQNNTQQNDGKSVQEKLKELKSMLDSNLITEEEYAKKRDELIDQL